MVLHLLNHVPNEEAESMSCSDSGHSWMMLVCYGLADGACVVHGPPQTYSFQSQQL